MTTVMRTITKAALTVVGVAFFQAYKIKKLTNGKKYSRIRIRRLIRNGSRKTKMNTREITDAEVRRQMANKI